jgi:uncharacterized protein (TIGR02996 family)
LHDLLTEIYESPREDGPRLVYADWLLERGDPRGEFIMLQFKEERVGLTAVEKLRVERLLKRHRVEWLGALAGVVDGEFRRGFLATAHVKKPIKDELALAPEWQTVETLRVTDAVGRSMWSRLPAITTLELVLTTVSSALLRELVASPENAGLERLVIRGPVGRSAWIVDLRRAFDVAIGGLRGVKATVPRVEVLRPSTSDKRRVFVFDRDDQGKLRQAVSSP